MSKIRDIDLIILSKVHNTDLLNICQVNKYFHKLYNNEHFWRNKIWSEYAKIYPEKDQTWKELYLKLVYLFKKYKYEKNQESFLIASRNGHLEVVKFLSTLDKVNVSADNNYAIKLASQHRHLEVVKFLSTLPDVDSSVDYNWLIKEVSDRGHLEIVKFLSTLSKVDASIDDNLAIVCASENGHLEVVKFLLTLPKVDASTQDNLPIYWAILNGKLEVVKFLLTLPNVDMIAKNNNYYINMINEIDDEEMINFLLSLK